MWGKLPLLEMINIPRYLTFGAHEDEGEMMKVFISDVPDLLGSDLLRFRHDAEEEPPIAGLDLIGVEDLCLTQILLGYIIVRGDAAFLCAAEFVGGDGDVLQFAKLVEDDVCCGIGIDR